MSSAASEGVANEPRHGRGRRRSQRYPLVRPPESCRAHAAGDGGARSSNRRRSARFRNTTCAGVLRSRPLAQSSPRDSFPRTRSSHRTCPYPRDSTPQRAREALGQCRAPARVHARGRVPESRAVRPTSPRDNRDADDFVRRGGGEHAIGRGIDAKERRNEAAHRERFLVAGNADLPRLCARLGRHVRIL